MATKLCEMTEQEAKNLSFKYLEDLMAKGINTLNAKQNQISNGLFFYGSYLYWSKKLEVTRLECVRDFAKGRILEDYQIFTECEATVNEWLEKGMPVD